MTELAKRVLTRSEESAREVLIDFLNPYHDLDLALEPLLHGCKLAICSTRPSLTDWTSNNEFVYVSSQFERQSAKNNLSAKPEVDNVDEQLQLEQQQCCKMPDAHSVSDEVDVTQRTRVSRTISILTCQSLR